jgi:hypothetical protein
LLALAAPAPGQTATATSFADVKKQLDGLKRLGLVGLVAEKSQSLHYIVDPALNRDGSACYTPPPPAATDRKEPATLGDAPVRKPPLRLSVAECRIPELLAMVTVRDASGNLPAFVAVQSTMDELFKEFHFGRQAKRSLHDFLRYEGGLRRERTNPVFTVQARFWVETPAGAEPNQGLLVCTLEVRAFRATLSPIESPQSTLQEYVNLTQLELLFQNRARGTVRLADVSQDPTEAFEAAICNALLNRVAASMCLSPACQDAIANVDKKRLDIKGRSIARAR